MAAEQPHSLSIAARTLVRALLWLALSAWLGGLIFFGAVVAPVAPAPITVILCRVNIVFILSFYIRSIIAVAN